MGNLRWLKMVCFHMLGTPESKRLNVAALNLWEASHLSFDRPLPGKPPKIPDRLPPTPKTRVFHMATQSSGGTGGIPHYFRKEGD
jgi:hypothetical protein